MWPLYDTTWYQWSDTRHPSYSRGRAPVDLGKLSSIISESGNKRLFGESG